jgi:hypothetical protein
VNVSDFYRDFRARYLFDDTPPYKIPDSFLLSALNEACNRAANASLCLYDDSTEELCQIPLESTQRVVPLDSRWVKIDRVRFVDAADNETPLARISQDELETLPDWRNGTGTPRFMVPKGYAFRMDKAPGTPGTLVEVAGWRMPLYPLEQDQDDPEIPEEYHYDLMFWMARCCALKPDPDPFITPTAAADYEARFVAAFGPYVPAHLRLWQMQHPTSLYVRPALTFSRPHR